MKTGFLKIFLFTLNLVNAQSFLEKRVVSGGKTKFLLSDFQVFGLRLCIKSFG